jgi:hypothetical protein
VKKFLMWAGRRSHNVQVQAACALGYGLLSLYGFNGTVAISLKLKLPQLLIGGVLQQFRVTPKGKHGNVR